MPTANDQWLRTIADPRDVRIFNTDKAYALWKSECGNYYAKIVPSKTDTRNGRLMLVLFIGKKKPIKGEVILNALDQLTTILIDENRTSDKVAIEGILKGLGAGLTPDVTIAPPPTSNTKAFRTYQTPQELITILQYPNQADYKGATNVLIVPSASVPQVGLPANFKLINSAILMSYSINRVPAGVTVNKNTVFAGDTIAIVYTKLGYVPQMVTCRIDGKPNSCIIYNGTEIIINDAATARVAFKKGVKLNVVSNTGSQLTAYKITGDQGRLDANGMLSFDQDKPQYKVRISANGYNTSEDIIITNEDFKDGVITVKLTPQQKAVSLTVKDIHGETKTGIVYVDSNSPIYSALSNYRGTINLAGGHGKDDGDDDDEEGGTFATIWKYAKWLVYFIVVAAVAFCGLWLWKGEDLFGGDKVELPGNSIEVTDSLPENKTDDQTEIEKADEAYLKNNDTWTTDSIKSDKYAALMDAIFNQDIDGIISHDYKNCDNVNGYWSSIVSSCEKLNETQSEHVADKIVRCCMNNEVEIDKLASALTTLSHTIDVATNEVGQMTDRTDRRGNEHSITDKSGSRGANSSNDSRGATPSNPSSGVPTQSGFTEY